ncbi:MAG: arylsulfatase [Acidobacteriia bacterium]|nr:arylsulfatase [Terriglobia bacterium]
MKRREFLAAAAASAAATSAGMAQAQAARKPNILFILADDLGYGNLGCYGGKQIETPNLDRMAAEGMRFTQAYAGATVCAPSRCTLMTGYHTGHARTRGNKYPDLPLRPQDLTVTEILKSAGYRTGLFGKWSLGQLGSTGYPTRKGFDEWFGFFSQTHAHNYYPEHLLENDSAFLLRGNMGSQRKDYAHDLFTERGLKFIERRTDQPFFLKLAYTIPHANNELGRDTGNGMEVPSTGSYAGKDWPGPDKNFAAMVTRLDADVGQIMAKLKETGQDRNTLVIFTSDNGPHREGGHNPEFFNDNGPLRGIKRDLYDGGIRVPFLARWAGTIKPGQTSDHLCAFWDFLPTASDLAGAAAPKGIDGISYAPTLLGKPGQRQHDYLYWEFHERTFQQAVRMKDWKGVRPGPGKPVELYNLKSGLDEQTNVAAGNPSIVANIEKIMASARTESPDWPVK